MSGSKDACKSGLERCSAVVEMLYFDSLRLVVFYCQSKPLLPNQPYEAGMRVALATQFVLKA